MIGKVDKDMEDLLSKKMAEIKARIKEKEAMKGVVIRRCYIEKETNKALLLRFKRNKERIPNMWVPKSLVGVKRNVNNFTGETTYSVSFPEWFYKQKILSYEQR